MVGGCLLLVIGGSGVDQGRVGSLGTQPSGPAWSEAHFMYNMSNVHFRAILGLGWCLPAHFYLDHFYV